MREENATPQRVARTQTLCHFPPYDKEAETNLKSPDLQIMDPQPKQNNISKNEGDTPEKNRAKGKTLTQEIMLS